jgi:predicted RNA binding protein YcfA (HicA-like mRNA interferase family)
LPKLTPRPTSRVLKALKRAGWALRADRPGSRHYVLEHLTRPGIVTVPRHPEIKKGTLGAIIKEAGLTLTEFERFYH